ncbi:mRNA decay activator protein ZFP36L2 [Rhinichthys klamathensis goyatoka]|uniref:mRNA decay activator protein ZFP36L2 n=1 Tax=Rhinichthys klamathensis goyatoka TaxID=3034132 RepID=UPI0024B6207F|nr:mRNA decay activator protein ZFP36L2 [Rhinichthys klamathensis goyatoka]
MSASVLSSIYDFDREKVPNSNAIFLQNMLEKRNVGVPFAASNTNTNTNSNRSFGYFRSNSTNHMDFNMSNRLQIGFESSTPAFMNKENKYRDRAFSDSSERSQQLQEILQQKPGSQINSTRYKTELCRPFEENGSCKYGEKCQFAHGYHELRNLSRHPKYKTEPCRTFHTIGFCPYGPRCHFIHNADERRAASSNTQARLSGVLGEKESSNPFLRQRERPKLHHSLSFSGFSSSCINESVLIDNPTSRTPPPPTCALTPSSPCLNAFTFPDQDLKAFLAPIIPQTQRAFTHQTSGGLYGNIQTNTCPPSPPFKMSHLPSMRPLSESPVFDSPPSPPDSLSDPEGYLSGSCSSSGTISGSESPSMDANRRLPIFSRLSISDD